MPLRAYAFCISLGVVAAVLIGRRRWRDRGGDPALVLDVATVCVPIALVGARLYHVVTSPAPYLKDPVSALFIWRGGLGIWGGVLAGFLSAAVLCKRRGVAPAAFADALAPALPVAQAIGRFGNYFNQELFGRPTTLPWGLEISPSNRNAVVGAQAYHPTFLYEALWDLGVAGLVVWADRRWQLDRGRPFALYVAAYTVGRAWIEALRIDDAANSLFGVRLNDYVSAAVFLCAVSYLIATRRRRAEPVALDQTSGSMRL